MTIKQFLFFVMLAVTGLSCMPTKKITVAEIRSADEALEKFSNLNGAFELLNPVAATPLSFTTSDSLKVVIRDGEIVGITQEYRSTAKGKKWIMRFYPKTGKGELLKFQANNYSFQFTLENGLISPVEGGRQFVPFVAHEGGPLELPRRMPLEINFWEDVKYILTDMDGDYRPYWVRIESIYPGGDDVTITYQIESGNGGEAVVNLKGFKGYIEVEGKKIHFSLNLKGVPIGNPKLEFLPR